MASESSGEQTTPETNMFLPTTKPNTSSAGLTDSAWHRLGPSLEVSETSSASQQTSQLVTTAHLRPGSRPMGGQGDLQGQPATYELVALRGPVAQFRGSVPYNVPTRRLMENSRLTHQPMSSLQLALSPLYSPFWPLCHMQEVGWAPWIPGHDAISPNKACTICNPTKIPIHRKELKVWFIHTVEYYAPVLKKNKEVLDRMI